MTTFSRLIIFGLLIATLNIVAVALAKSPMIDSKSTTMTAVDDSEAAKLSRQELKAIINSTEIQKVDQIISAAAQLISQEYFPDVDYLLDYIVKHQNTTAAEPLIALMLNYSNRQFIKNALIKASQSKSREQNYLAAGMLIDLKEIKESLAIIIRLVKNGDVSDKLIDLAQKIQKLKSDPSSQADFSKLSTASSEEEKIREFQYVLAHMLIDIDEPVEALMMMVELIKRGEVNQRVLGIIERVPEPSKLDGKQLSKDAILYNQDIQGELSKISNNKSVPNGMRIFVDLIGLAYYKGELQSRDVKEITSVLDTADEEYLMVAMKLLEIAMKAKKTGLNYPWEIIKELKQHKNEKISKLANDVDEKKSLVEKQRVRGIISGNKPEYKNPEDEIQNREQWLYDYLFQITTVQIS